MQEICRGLASGRRAGSALTFTPARKKKQRETTRKFKNIRKHREKSVQTVHRKKHTRCQRNPRGFHQHLVLPCSSKMFNYSSLFNLWGFVTTRVCRFGHTKLQITKVRPGDAAQDYSIVTFATEQEPLRGCLFFPSWTFFLTHFETPLKKKKVVIF